MDEVTKRRIARDAHAYRLLQAEALLAAFERAEGRLAMSTAELTDWATRNRETAMRATVFPDIR
jgi:hypothetical protein